MLSRVFLLLLIACFPASPAWAQSNPFIGQWKLVKLTDTMKVTKVRANQYAFDFGGGTETIVVDGKQQAARAGTTLSVSADGQRWKVIRKQGGRKLLTATWTLSKDGNMLKDDFTSFSRDGSPSNISYVYERKSAGSGFAGTWVSMAAAPSSVIMLQIRRYNGNGLALIVPSAGRTLNVDFDGKQPAGAAGSVLSGQRLSARSIEIFRKTKGKIAETRRLELSPDLKVLTMTLHIAGNDRPYIYIFEKRYS